MSTTAASTQGISKAEASKAEIFRVPHEPSEHQHDTPIRLKKAPQDYGENATLALGMTKTSGSFLRKVAASFGSASATSSHAPPLSVGSKSTLQSPPRLIKKAPLPSIQSDEKIPALPIDQQPSPVNAALKITTAIDEEEEAAEATSQLREKATPPSAQADDTTETAKAEVLYFM